MFQIALRAVRHGLFANVFSAVALAAVLTPLLVLYGLKLGIINGMVAELKKDPSILRIGTSGYKSLTEEDIAAIRALPQTGFVAGAPRSIAARVEMRRGLGDMDFTVADWLPSGVGDPLMGLGTTSPRDTEIVLSEPLAEKLGATTGDTVIGAVYRNDQSETYETELRVAAVLPRRMLAGERALVSTQTLNLLAAFSDGFAIPGTDLGGRALSERIALYDSLRLYASSLDTVTDLERVIASQYGFRTSSEAANIEWVRELERVMTGVFAIISVGGVAGYSISLWATIAGSVHQNRPQLSLLRLLGVRRGTLWLFPIVQAACITTAGLVAALVFALAAATVMNKLYLADMFAGQICQIRLEDFLIAACASYLLVALVAFQQLGVLRRISPTEALAESLS